MSALDIAGTISAFVFFVGLIAFSVYEILTAKNKIKKVFKK
jgi:hypothetical protein